ncbi:XAP5, circadian clock regulator-domain-containing protein [Peziza echinospora]|nr:XAP5, circadian clock regulator-domain-containing protein [Peziza echinospora]
MQNIPTPTSASGSGANTPTTRFTGTTETLEDVLKTQTVGLVHLSEFKKRRVELLEQKEREAAERGRIAGSESAQASTAGTPSEGTGASSGSGLKEGKIGGLGGPGGLKKKHSASTTTKQQHQASSSSSSSQLPPKKKRKAAGVNKGKLSFAADDDEDNDENTSDTHGSGGVGDAAGTTPPAAAVSATASTSSKDPTPDPPVLMKKPKPNPMLPHPPPKAMTKSSLLRDFQEREILRREFLSLQERIKNEEIIIPFVFYDGTNVIPRENGVKVKKGEAVWLFLERARRMSGRREWLRVSVDDLLLVRGEVIIPHHYEFYYFLVNRTEGPNGLLFNYPSPLEGGSVSGTSGSAENQAPPPPVLGTEDPTMTKVVDRRWYERNKHIFPASVWTNFDPAKDYKGMVRRDRDNNAFFFG